MKVRWICFAVAAVAALLGASASLAATISGTPGNDVLRGTARADRLLGKGGNDRLYGLGGKDVLVGGSGKDLLVGGPGADTLRCGPGRDVAMAGAGDKVAVDCETVKGLPKPPLLVGDVSLAEGNSGTTTLSFPVTLAKATQVPVTVRFATADGTALAASDYASATGTLRLRPGETRKTIEVTVNGDGDAEQDEAFTVALSAPVNATLSKGAATGTIINDDPRRYTGTTSQGKPIAFVVAADRSSLSSLSLSVDVNCTEVPVTVPDVPFDFGSEVFPLKSDGSFAIDLSGGDSSGSIHFVLGGAAGAGQASGSLRVDAVLNTDFGVVHCSTGALTWNAV